ncbi:MAG: glycosyltransferase family 2 protein [Flavobacteriales bacterium]
MSSTTQISIVIPVYNAEVSLDELLSRIHDALNKEKLSFEIIMIDDASRDKSWRKIQELKEKYPATVNGIRLMKNCGQHVAILCGFNFVKGDVIVTMDDDLQHNPDDVIKLIQKQKETRADVVYGIFAHKKHGVIRSTGSYILRKGSKPAFGTVGEGSSFRCFTKDIVDNIKQHFHSFVFIDEIINWYTSDIELVELEHHASKKARSGYSIFGLFSMFSNILVNYTAVPLRLMTYGGLILSLISFLAGIYFIVKRVWLKIDVPGFTATIVVILFSTSIILICFGIIGQYLYRLYNMQMGKPVFQIKEKI